MILCIDIDADIQVKKLYYKSKPTRLSLIQTELDIKREMVALFVPEEIGPFSSYTVINTRPHTWKISKALKG